METIQQQITDIAAASGRRYISLKNLAAALPANLRKELGLTTRDSQNRIRRAVEAVLPKAVFRKKGQVWFLVSGSDEEVVAAQITTRPKTLKQIALRGFVFTAAQTADVLGRLIEQGKITVKVAPSGLALLQSPDTGPEAGGTGDICPEKRQAGIPDAWREKAAAFKAAFDRVGKGRRFVYIHLIRRSLAWPREVFDAVLDRLMVEGYAAGHAGDPGALSKEEIEDAYRGPMGDLYLTVGWRRPL